MPPFGHLERCRPRTSERPGRRTTETGLGLAPLHAIRGNCEYTLVCRGDVDGLFQPVSYLNSSYRKMEGRCASAAARQRLSRGTLYVLMIPLQTFRWAAHLISEWTLHPLFTPVVSGERLGYSLPAWQQRSAKQAHGRSITSPQPPVPLSNELACVFLELAAPLITPGVEESARRHIQRPTA